jgi:hypothetical protein
MKLCKRKRLKMKKSFLFITTLIVILYGISAQADKKIPKGKNIALGKSYTTSVMPTRKWQKLLKSIPNYEKILTDGVTFYKAGEFKNNFDDYSIKNQR